MPQIMNSNDLGVNDGSDVIKIVRFSYVKILYSIPDLD